MCSVRESLKFYKTLKSNCYRSDPRFSCAAKMAAPHRGGPQFIAADARGAAVGNAVATSCDPPGGSAGRLAPPRGHAGRVTLPVGR